MLVIVDKGDTKVHFSIAKKLLHRGVGKCATPFLRFLYFTLGSYLIMLSFKPGCIDAILESLV